MRKKRRNQQTPDGTNIHPVGRERFICVQRYVGDLPSEESVDWFDQPEEYEPNEFLLGTADSEPRKDD